jgi:NAD(P)H-hydrate repair Nnr-like enzyme with NAD(P)H-hydrate dehydratase domain
MAPEYMTEPLDETASGTVDFSAIDRVLECRGRDCRGSGLGRPGDGAFVHAPPAASVPIVLDADALNIRQGLIA